MKSRNNSTSIVTGAFGYTGKYITQRLLSMGESVRTLTWHARENPFGARVAVFPFNFDKPEKLVESLRGASTFFNTYWVRFPRGGVTYEKAVENTKTLIRAAKEAGIRRFVHISITNCAEDSSLPYFKGKADIEKALIKSGLSYAIVRPTVIFGQEDILINNIAWLLRKFPAFAVMGSGNYRIRPVFVEDVAKIAVDAAHDNRNMILDAVGPETYTFDQLVHLIRRTMRSKAMIIHVPPRIAYFFSKLIGWIVGDVTLTRDEVKGLMADLLVTDGPPSGETRLSAWLAKNADTVGVRYASELKRHYR